MDRKDCTIKIWQAGKSKMCTGWYRDMGIEALGCELDPHADFGIEYGRPLIELVMSQTYGRTERIRAWIHSVDGQCIIADESYVEPVLVGKRHMVYRFGEYHGS
jgi:hypothetical protein